VKSKAIVAGVLALAAAVLFWVSAYPVAYGDGSLHVMFLGAFCFALSGLCLFVLFVESLREEHMPLLLNGSEHSAAFYKRNFWVAKFTLYANDEKFLALLPYKKTPMEGTFQEVTARFIRGRAVLALSLIAYLAYLGMHEQAISNVWYLTLILQYTSEIFKWLAVASAVVYITTIHHAIVLRRIRA
jgi:hypothetical protein